MLVSVGEHLLELSAIEACRVEEEGDSDAGMFFFESGRRGKYSGCVRRGGAEVERCSVVLCFLSWAKCVKWVRCKQLDAWGSNVLDHSCEVARMSTSIAHRPIAVLLLRDVPRGFEKRLW